MIKAPNAISKVRVETFAGDNSKFAILNDIERVSMTSQERKEKIWRMVQDNLNRAHTQQNN